MPISIDEYATPTFSRLRERYPISYDKVDRFNEINPRHDASRYMGEVGKEGGWKYAGYNPNHNSIRTEKFNTRGDNVVLKPY